MKVSADIGYAEVYVTVMGRELGDEQSEVANKETLDVLNKASGFLRHELSRRIKDTYYIRLRFHYDKTNAYGNYMFGLIAEAVKDLPEQGQDDKISSNKSHAGYFYGCYRSSCELILFILLKLYLYIINNLGFIKLKNDIEFKKNQL